MQVIAILSQKGGAGKTTIAANLAVAAGAESKATAIIDLDPQASACTWSDNRDSESPNVDSMQPARLSKAVDALESAGADLLIIDTPPQTEQAALQATNVADIVIIPCRAGFLDLVAINHTLSLINAQNKKAILVFNALPTSGNAGAEALEAVASYNAIIAPVQIHQRVAFMHAMRDGLGVTEYEPKGKAANEIQTLYRFIKKELKNG